MIMPVHRFLAGVLNKITIGECHIEDLKSTESEIRNPKIEIVIRSYNEASYKRRLPFACNFFLNFRPITINFLAGLKFINNGRQAVQINTQKKDLKFLKSVHYV